MISVTGKGGSRKTRDRLAKMQTKKIDTDLDRFGRMGVEALARATPVDTNLSAESWGYRIERDSHGPRLVWFNTNSVNGTPVVILLVYGHGTGTGGYVQGRNFINPAIRPIFDHIKAELRKKVKS
jgi:hypothetical protein